MQIKINVEVKEDGKTLRSFKGLPVNLWDTAKENLEHYEEEMLHLCFIGTSGKVNLQNRIRGFAADQDEKGEYVNSDDAVRKFAADCEVTVGAGSELQSEKSTLVGAMDAKALAAHEAAMAYAEQFNKQASSNVSKRKEAKTADSQK